MLIRCYICNKLYHIPNEVQGPYICPKCVDKPVKKVVEGSAAQRDIEKYLKARKEQEAL